MTRARRARAAGVLRPAGVGGCLRELSAADERPRSSGRTSSGCDGGVLLGRDEDSVQVWERAHHELLRRADEERAARCAGWMVFVLMNGGEFARAGGWLARARGCSTMASATAWSEGISWCRSPFSTRSRETGRAPDAISGQAAEIGDRFGDIDLVTLARNIQGRALIGQGETVEGMTLLDELMVAVIADEVSEIVAGAVYWSVIEACQEVFDLRRAQQWTAALTHWCDSRAGSRPVQR